MLQLILHLVGDYVTQSDWMARRKTESSEVAAIHALVYGLPFLLVGIPNAVGFIILSHFLVDRFRLARYVVFAKNFMCPVSEQPSWDDCRVTGYPSQRPQWMAIWLLIIADNTIHLACNYAALAIWRQ